jgi:hypothetical protein
VTTINPRLNRRPRWYEPVTRFDRGRAAVMATGIGLMAALALDLVLGWWTAAPWLHMVLAITSFALWAPSARRVRYLTLGPLYVLGLYLYTVLRSFADDTGITPRAGYAIALERELFFGHVPTVWLQEQLFRPAQLGLLDWLTVQVHWSYFFVPHLAGLLVWLFRRELFARYVFIMLGTLAGRRLRQPARCQPDHGLRRRAGGRRDVPAAVRRHRRAEPRRRHAFAPHGHHLRPLSLRARRQPPPRLGAARL